MSEAESGRRRRRGRPSSRDTENRRAAILEAATAEFDEKGFDGATVRSVARRAGVDPALLHHYFGTKADLFAESVGFPVRPDQRLPEILSDGVDGAGKRIVRWLLETWRDPGVRKRGISLIRAAVGNRMLTPLIGQFIRREVLDKISGELPEEDAQLRSELIATQVVGMLAGRYVLKLPALQEADDELLVEWYGPTIQRYLDGDQP